jgi:hypothetical protein
MVRRVWLAAQAERHRRMTQTQSGNHPPSTGDTVQRITLSIDSATADQAREFVLAFQITRPYGLPAQGTTVPTVTMMGIGWGVTTPAMEMDRGVAMMRLLDVAAPVEIDAC